MKEAHGEGLETFEIPTGKATKKVYTCNYRIKKVGNMDKQSFNTKGLVIAITFKFTTPHSDCSTFHRTLYLEQRVS